MFDKEDVADAVQDRMYRHNFLADLDELCRKYDITMCDPFEIETRVGIYTIRRNELVGFIEKD